MDTDILSQIVALAVPHRSVEDVMSLSLDAVLRWLGQVVGGAYLAQGKELRLVAQRGLGARLAAWQQWVPPREDDGASTGQVRVLTLAEMGLGQASGATDILSVLLLPLAKQGGCGFLVVCAPSLLVFTEAESQFLSTVGHTVGLVAQCAGLTAQSAHNARTSQAALDMARALISAPDADSMLNLLVYTVVQVTENATSGAVCLLDAEQGDLSSVPLDAADSRSAEAKEKLLVALGQRVALQALDEDRVVYVADIARDARFADMVAPSAHRSLLVAPLQASGRSIGVLAIESLRPYAFTPADERFVMSLAIGTAQAIEHKRLEWQRIALAKERSRLLLSDIGHLLSAVAHDLRNPLTAVMGYTQLLQTTDGFGSTALPDLAKIQSQAQKAAKITNGLSGLARHCRAGVNKADLNGILGHISALCAHALAARNIELQVDLNSDGPIVAIDPPRFQQILLRLLIHAQDVLSCVPDRGYIRVTTDVDGDWARVRFSYGWAAPSSPQPRKEALANRAQVPPDGLSIYAELVEECGGSMVQLDTPGDAATWVIGLPLAHEAGLVPSPDRYTVMPG